LVGANSAPAHTNSKIKHRFQSDGYGTIWYIQPFAVLLFQMKIVSGFFGVRFAIKSIHCSRELKHASMRQCQISTQHMPQVDEHYVISSLIAVQVFFYHMINYHYHIRVFPSDFNPSLSYQVAGT
jgi:hypothetical protein